MPVCNVCTDDKPGCFSCAHCKYLACAECTGRWFESQAGTPSCMECRRALDITNLRGCFSNTAAIQLFENKRRESVVLADEAYHLETMTSVIPTFHKYKKNVELVRSGIEVVRGLEESQEVIARALNDAIKEKLRPKEISKLRAATRQTHFDIQRTYKELVLKPLRAANLLMWNLRYHDADRLTGNETPPWGLPMGLPDMQAAAAAVPAEAAAAVAEHKENVPERFLKCTVDACAGLFKSTVGACMVCEATHCIKCHVHYTGAHTCAPGARETARVVLAQTKGCPRCHAAIMRSSGCPQMMCTSCNCIFNWITGLEEKGVVHNPHFYMLSVEARQKVIDDRMARGLQAPSLETVGPALYVCPAGNNMEFDPMCIPFEDGRIFTALSDTFRGLFPVLGRTWNDLAAEYQNVLHVDRYEVQTIRDDVRKTTGEKALRMQRIARLTGPVLGVKRFHTQKKKKAALPEAAAPEEEPTPMVVEEEEDEDGDDKAEFGQCQMKFSEKYVVCVTHKRLDDTRYAALLMRQDTMRNRLMSRLEIQMTYEETQKDQFRAALLVPPSERVDALRRIFDYRAETLAQLRHAAMYDRKDLMRNKVAQLV